MGKTKLVRVDVSLIDIFGRVGKEFAKKIKKEYNLEELFVPDTLASQVLAGKFNGQKTFNFQVVKTSSSKGRLVIVK